MNKRAPKSITTLEVSTIFQSKQHILDLIERSDDKNETTELIAKLKENQKTRIPFYLMMDEFDAILKWKLRGQFNRQGFIRKLNTSQNVKLITQTAFSIDHEDKKFETELKLKLLSTITGVDIPVASAILTLCYPELYAVIDFRNWRQVYGKDVKPYYSAKKYIEYLGKIRELAVKHNVTPQQIDMAMWQLDQEPNR